MDYGTNSLFQQVRTEPMLPPGVTQTMTSNGAPNATEVVGRVIDRLAAGRLYRSARMSVAYGASVLSSQGVAFTGRMLHATSTADADFSAFGSTGITRTLATTTSATSTSHAGVCEFDYDLQTARRYIRFNLTPAIVASSSGALSYGGCAMLGGADENPEVALTATDRATTS